MQTERLIRDLASAARPVRPLTRPWTRAAVWTALAAPWIAAIVVVMSVRPDLSAKLADPRFVVEQAATLATGITAAAAAFATTIPGYRRSIVLLPALPLAIWLGSLGQSCLATLVVLGPHGLALRPGWLCLPAIALTGALPALAMMVMLRRGAPLFPHLSVGLGALAAAGLGNFGLRLFHPQDSSLMVLVWQFGSVFLLTALATCAGRHVLSWPSQPPAYADRNE